MKELKDSHDFHWYKIELDLNRKTGHIHSGIPDKFPCRVTSEWEPSDNSQDIYCHQFIYRQEVVCSQCGHKTLVWPETNE